MTTMTKGPARTTCPMWANCWKTRRSAKVRTSRGDQSMWIDRVIVIRNRFQFGGRRFRWFWWSGQRNNRTDRGMSNASSESFQTDSLILQSSVNTQPIPSEQIKTGLFYFQPFFSRPAQPSSPLQRKVIRKLAKKKCAQSNPQWCHCQVLLRHRRIRRKTLISVASIDLPVLI